MISLLGIVLFPVVAYLFSSNRKAISKRTVLGAFALQAGLGGLILYVPLGKSLLEALAEKVVAMLGYSQAGIDFLFGSLVAEGAGFVFAFNVLPVIVFFSALIAVLYYLHIMQWLIKLIGGALRKLLKTSHTESMASAANIFIGQTEAPLVVRPYIAGMTRSELFAVMVGGLASIAGSVMAGYAALGIEMKYLLAASFMAAPGGLMMAKIMIPETETPAQPDAVEGDDSHSYVNIFDAAAAGAMTGLQMAMAVGAMLLAFIALIAALNGLLGWTSSLIGFEAITIEGILGYLFQPIAFLLGVPWSEATIAGGLIGQKLVLNEFVAYIAYLDLADTLSPITQAVVVFALCGFANFSSIAILLGGLGALAPSRRDDISRLGVRALLAATLANLLSAALAGFFLSF
ncbi:MAG: NupC/NupG family nucleoside CNT transporter [Pseudomonadales bacterium]|nr:NupC/NupG family nucleoside CNT transporter [Pseudomonadales bacterium]MDA0760169.1 NupC/NupG family nucleoside CNT transporter [Pseudomonadota bacterium]MDA0957257.1 NupC/NupG family nucleoside CNT transporter [Pseudomonadota bacterium]